MKLLLFYIAVSGLISSHLFAETSVRDVVKQKIATFEASKNHRMPVVYPELADRVQAMFLRYNATRINLAGVSKGIKKGTDIYISNEEIYIDAPAGGWNLAANRFGTFEWEAGKKTGIKIKRNNEELVEYLLYLTDPSWIITSLYSEYLSSPNEFNVVRNKIKKWSELRLKTPRYGLEAIYVSERPLWFHGLRATNPETNKQQEMIVSEPEEIKAIPAEVSRKMQGVKFENSTLTLQRHMVFL